MIFFQDEINSNQNRFLFGMCLIILYLRLFAGATGIEQLTPATTLLLCVGSFIVLIFNFKLSKDTILVVVGIFTWLAISTISWVENGPLRSPQFALTQVTLLLTYALFANALGILAKTKQSLDGLDFFLKAFLILGFVLCVYQIASGNGFTEHGHSTYNRAFGSDVHPVSYSLQLTIAFVGLEIARKKSAKPLTASYFFFLTITLISLYLTYSRTGWVLFTLIFFGYSVMSLRPIWRFIIIPTGGAFMTVALLTSARFDDLASLGFFFENYDFKSGVFDYRFVDNSISWRFANWSIGLKLFFESWLLGYGPGQSVAVSQFELAMHNLFLEVMVDTGILGLLPAMLVLIGFARVPKAIRSHDMLNTRLRHLWHFLSFALFLNITFSNSLIGQTMTIILLIVARTILAAPKTLGTQSVEAKNNLSGAQHAN